ncbi:hypothetical protein L249_2780, partial [Ophiocordyceps polyrhachis-furcata BCC 54312]
MDIIIHHSEASATTWLFKGGGAKKEDIDRAKKKKLPLLGIGNGTLFCFLEATTKATVMVKWVRTKANLIAERLRGEKEKGGKGRGRAKKAEGGPWE